MEEDLFTVMELPEIIKYACSQTEVKNDTNPGRANDISSKTSNHEEIIERFRETITPNDQYDDVIGYEVILRTIAKSFARKIEGMKKKGYNARHIANHVGINGFLLFGVSGVGKTEMLKFVAVKIAKILKTDISFINVNASAIMDKYVGETQKLIDALYSLGDKTGPTLICVDEIDGFCNKRKDNEEQHVRSFKTQFLASMGGMVPHPNTITAAACNLPWDLDNALLRRFQMKYHIQVPRPKDRMKILRNAVLFSTGRPVQDHQNLKLDSEVLKLTEGFTGSDLTTAVKRATHKVTSFVYQGVTLTDEQFDELQKEIEASPDPVTHIVGNLTDEILIQHGIKSVSPSYSTDELERLIEFSRDVGAISPFDDGGKDNQQEQQSCNINLFGLFCCCIGC